MTRLIFSFKDFIMTAGVVIFFFGCIASSHRTARTLDGGQVSVSGSYLRAENLDESDATPIQLFALDARLGATRGMDFGIMHTWDISSDNGNQFATFWGDFKVQLTNRDNIVGQPIFSLGLMKGYVYPEGSDVHITSFPLMLSLPVSETVTPTLMYRHELVSEDFIPSSFSDPRSTFSLGAEFCLQKPSTDNWTPKLGISVGTFNSLAGGDGDRGLILNLGFSIDAPLRK